MAKSKEEKEKKENEAAVAADAERRERAVVVAVVRDGQSVAQTEEFLAELEFLAETADIDTVHRFMQRMPQPSSRLYVGPGKLEEIAAYCEENLIDVAIFDDELSPSADAQHREGAAVPRDRPHAPDPRHLHVARPHGLCQDAGGAGA